MIWDKIPPRPDESWAEYLIRVETTLGNPPELLATLVGSIKADMRNDNDNITV